MRAALLCLAALAALCTSGQTMAERTYRDDVSRLRSEAVTLATAPAAASRAVEVRFRAAEDAVLGLRWSSAGSEWAVEVTYGFTDPDAVMSDPVALLTLSGPDSIAGRHAIAGRHMSRENLNAIELYAEGGRVSVSFGHDELEPVFMLDMPGDVNPDFQVYARGEVTTPLIVAEWTPAAPFGLPGDDRTDAAIADAIASATDGPVGMWAELDRDMNSRYAATGGRYELAVIPSAEVEGAWDIVYLSGAAVHPDLWHRGMIKGRLFPTSFQDHYDLQWVDADGTPRLLDCNASLDRGAILTLAFPALDSTLRLRRLAKGER